MSALVGGGLRARSGGISLAHNGVLFLDELPEFSGQVLDSLRQPLETGEVVLSRAYPARFMLIAAMNPCRCGRASDPGFICKRGQNMHCAPEPTAGCRARWSTGSICSRDGGRSHSAASWRSQSRGCRARGAGARIQVERYATLGLSDVRTNAQVSGAVLEEVARADSAGLALLRGAADSMRLTARGYHRILRVARTLADLDRAERVGRVHLTEALSYRALADDVRRAA